MRETQPRRYRRMLAPSLDPAARPNESVLVYELGGDDIGKVSAMTSFGCHDNV